MSIDSRLDRDGIADLVHDRAAFAEAMAADAEALRQRLVATLNDIGGQLGVQRAAYRTAWSDWRYQRALPDGFQSWEEFQRESDDWRRRATNLKRRIEAAIAECKGAAKERRMQVGRTKTEEDYRTTREALRRLACAVVKHQRRSQQEDLAAEPHDRALWAMLDELEVPFSVSCATLREMVDMAWSE